MTRGVFIKLLSKQQIEFLPMKNQNFIFHMQMTISLFKALIIN